MARDRPDDPYDVLVIGAGPAGSAAALILARSGLRVLLADRHEFPRDKACGDALIPDAQAALAELGLLSTVQARAHAAREIRIYTPAGSHIPVAGGCLCLPRRALDALLLEQARNAGAQFRARCKAISALELNGLVTGARFVDLVTGSTIEVQANLTLLATGASADVLSRFGMCLRAEASATAARIYVRAAPHRAEEHRHLTMSYAGEVYPGYGWIFPGPQDVFNIGVGYYYDSRIRPRERNTRKLLHLFCRDFAPAARLLEGAEVIGPVQGAPLRTGMRGARFSRAGLMVIGEAAGLTYSFSGEGIGKALASGILSARLFLEEQPQTSSGHARLAASYERALHEAFASRFAAYRRIQRWLSWRPLVDLLGERARRSRHVRSQLESLLDETGDPRALFSLTGLARALVR